MDIVRTAYVDSGQRPTIAFVVFGFDGDLSVSRERYRVAGLPQGLTVHILGRSEHAAYIDGYFDGYLGQLLSEKDPAFAALLRGEESVIAMMGNIEHDGDLIYLQSCVGVVQFMLDNGASGVLDMFSLKWMTGAEWKADYFDENSARWANHVIILNSEEEGAYWLHTRGMTKFGRPDISIKKVPGSRIDEARTLIDRIVALQIGGAVLDHSRAVDIPGNTAGLRFVYVDEPDNPDFNNVYFEAVWRET